MAKAKNEAKIKFLADTQGFRDGVKDANASLSELSSELKLNAAQMKTSGKTTEKLVERKELLESQLEQASKKTENLSAQMEACTRNYGENSDEARKLAIQINNAKSAEERIRQEINNVTEELDAQAAASVDNRGAMKKLEDTISDQESALSDLKEEYIDVALEYGTNSREAKDLAKQISELSGDLNKNRGTMAKAERAADNLADEVDDAGDAAEDASDSFTVWKGTLADLASSGIQGIWGEVTGLASSFWDLGDETRELRTEMGKLDAAFSASGYSADAARATYETLYGVIGETDQSVEAAQQIALLSNNTADAAKWADLAAGVVGRFGDALQPETFFEAANETLKLGEATGAYTQMLEGTGMNVDTFNAGLAACVTEEEKQAYMLEVSNAALAAAGEAYKQNNAQIIEANEAQSNYNNGLSGLGEIIEPIKTTFVNGMAGMLTSAAEFISGFDVEGIKASINDAFTFINGTVFPAIKTGIQWFIDNKDLVIGGLAAIVAGIAAFEIVSIVQTAVSAFKAFQSATAGLTLAQKALNLVMKMNPIGLVTSLIVGLVAGFIYLWNNCEGFRQFWVGLWENIKTVISGAWDNIKKFVSDAVGNVRNKISSVFYTVKDIVSSVWDGIKTKISGAWDSIVSGVTDKINAVKSKITSVFYRVKTTVTSVWDGIKSAIEDPINTAKTTVENVIDKIKGAFDFDWSLPKIKLPHFSVSGGKAPWGFMGEGSLPSVSIDWYAKGAVLKSPTIFGMDKQGNLMGGGEAGEEAVAPIDVLLGYVRTAVSDVVGGMTLNLDSVAPSHVDRLGTYVNSSNGDLGDLIDAIERLASRPIELDIDGMRFATATANATDNVSGNRLNLKNRGLAL